MTRFGRFSRDTRQLRLFIQVAWAGVEYGETARQLAEMVGDNPELGTVAEQVAAIEELERFAKTQRSEGFPLLTSLVAIRTWTLLETLVNDLVVARLSDPKNASQELRKLRGPLIEFLEADTEERAEYLTDLLTQEVKAKLKPGVGRFESLLDAVGIGGPVAEAARRYLLELSEVRNVLVHRDGLADGRLVERCPWLNLRAKDMVRVPMARVQRYILAAEWYGLEISRRLAESEPDEAKRLEYSGTLRKTLDLMKITEEYLTGPEIATG